MKTGTGTPWGRAQDVKEIGRGVWIVETASHGGLRLSAEAAKAVPIEVGRTFINGPAWAEEDIEAPIATAFLMAERVIDDATIRRTWPSVSPERMWEYAHASAANDATYEKAAEPLREAEAKWRRRGGNEHPAAAPKVNPVTPAA